MANALRKRTGDLRALLADLLGPLATSRGRALDLADEFIVCVEGSIVLARIHADPSYVRRGLERFRRRLEEPEARPR